MASIALANVWKTYLSLLEKKPIATKVATGVVMTCLGDLTAQLVLEQKHEVDPKRLAVLTGYGVIGSIVEGHYWLGALEKMIGPSMGWKASVKKMILDVSIFAPIEVAGCLSWTHVFEQHPGLLRDKLREDFFPTLVSSFFFWCPFSFIGFLLVPFHLRVLYGTSVCLLWDTFLSYASHNKIGEIVSKLEDKVTKEETPNNITDDT